MLTSASTHLTHGELFAGISGFGLGFARAGIRTLWHVEKDADCQKVLRRHYPSGLLLSDIREAGKHNLPYVNIISMGFPCQGLSLAGKRAGLADDRSGLFFEGLRVIYELQPTYAIWENVPGLLTSCSCRKCRRRCTKCGTIAGADDESCDVCGGNEFRGRVLPEHRGADFFTVVSSFGFIGMDGAWTLLDAQFFGVPQRRRRLFGVFAQRHIGVERCTQILSFLTRSKGNPPPSREKRPGFAAAITERTRGIERNLEMQEDLAYALTNPGSGGQSHSKLIAYGGNNTGGEINVACAFNAHATKRYDFESETFITSAFNGYTGGADDNDAQGWHIVPALSETLNSGGNEGGFRTEPGAHIVSPIMGFDQSRGQYTGDIAAPLRVNGAVKPGVNDGKPDNMCVSGPMGVRRLTPVECNRLQGFPDDWNEWGLDEQGNRVELSDSARYRQAGNAVAVPCARWIGNRIRTICESLI